MTIHSRDDNNKGKGRTPAPPTPRPVADENQVYTPGFAHAQKHKHTHTHTNTHTHTSPPHNGKEAGMKSRTPRNRGLWTLITSETSKPQFKKYAKRTTHEATIRGLALQEYRLLCHWLTCNAFETLGRRATAKCPCKLLAHETPKCQTTNFQGPAADTIT